MIQLKCKHCGLTRSEHHEFEPAMPNECRCEPSTWEGGKGDVVPPVCAAFVGPATGDPDDTCERCNHDRACHSRPDEVAP